MEPKLSHYNNSANAPKISPLMDDEEGQTHSFNFFYAQ